MKKETLKNAGIGESMTNLKSKLLNQQCLSSLYHPDCDLLLPPSLKKHVTVWWVYLFTGLFSATDSLLFWGAVCISFEDYFSKYHQIILSLAILAVFKSSHLLYAFIELFCSSSKDFKPTYHMHQIWLKKCVMSGKEPDENFWCRDDCKAGKR